MTHKSVAIYKFIKTCLLFCITEEKLAKFQEKQPICSKAEKRDLLLSLEGTHRGHIDRLINSTEVHQFEEDPKIPTDNLTGSLVRYLTPQLQAVVASEFVELLKADQLDNLDNSDSPSPSSPSE